MRLSPQQYWKNCQLETSFPVIFPTLIATADAASQKMLDLIAKADINLEKML